ncbi:MAG TPA: hypothetical protein PK800_03005 [Syntrophorhabdaceae bacterium]|nr:hypothetical protein [Syntrophorhabdaceae bacterium]
MFSALDSKDINNMPGFINHIDNPVGTIPRGVFAFVVAYKRKQILSENVEIGTSNAEQSFLGGINVF